jgi:hypothetical protein
VNAAWGPVELERLKERWADGATASQIAFEFGDGRTRNSIIGKAHALGLPGRERPKATKSRAQRKRDGEVVGGVRKAYASRGDDCTLSRFVKVKGEHKEPRRRTWFLPGLRTHPTIAAGRSLFHAKRTFAPDELPHVLVSGHNNVKIGRDVRKGPLRGYWIYTLSLEERATCPRTCRHWETCYGNNMPWAKRLDHRDTAKLEAAIEADIQRRLAQRGRRGILVRLHALGDFFSVDYVWFWRRMLTTYDRLAVYGYTARLPGTPIGDAIGYLMRDFGPRFAMRYSDGGMASNCTVSVKAADLAPPDATVCPEQTGKTLACATCGLCWHSSRNVAFVEH